MSPELRHHLSRFCCIVSRQKVVFRTWQRLGTQSIRSYKIWKKTWEWRREKWIQKMTKKKTWEKKI